MEVSSQAVRSLMEIGVAASSAGLFRQAMAIFEGVEAVRPDSEGPAVGVALAQMSTRAHDAAAKTLRDHALVKNPKSIEAKMILGLALKLGGRNAECDSVIKELNASGDAKAKAFAVTLQNP